MEGQQELRAALNKLDKVQAFLARMAIDYDNSTLSGISKEMSDIIAELRELQI